MPCSLFMSFSTQDAENGESNRAFSGFRPPPAADRGSAASHLHYPRGWASMWRSEPMVCRPEPNWRCDALIVASPAVGEFATELDAELGRLGLRVKLHVVPTKPGKPLPDSCMADARTARLCVL